MRLINHLRKLVDKINTNRSKYLTIIVGTVVVCASLLISVTQLNISAIAQATTLPGALTGTGTTPATTPTSTTLPTSLNGAVGINTPAKPTSDFALDATGHPIFDNVVFANVKVNDGGGLWANDQMTEVQCQQGYTKTGASNFYCRGKKSDSSNSGFSYAANCTFANTAVGTALNTNKRIVCDKTVVPSNPECESITDATKKATCFQTAKDYPTLEALNKSSGAITDQSSLTLKAVKDAADAKAAADKAVADKEALCKAMSGDAKTKCEAELATLKTAAADAQKKLDAASATAAQSKSDDGCGGDVLCWITNIVIGLLTAILWLLIQLLKFILGLMGGMFVVLVSVNPAGNSLLNIAYTPWQSVVNVANIILIAGIIFMGFGYILNLDIIKKSKGLQDFLLGILVVGVLMQFTFSASAAVVNFTNGLGNIIYFGAGGIAGKAIQESENTSPALKQCLINAASDGGDSGIAFVNTFVCNVSQVSKITSIAESGDDKAVWKALGEAFGSKAPTNFVTTAIALAIFVLAIFSFAKALFVLLVRIFGVWILIVLSPLALVAWFSPLPMIKDFGKQWMDNFLKLSFAYPFYTFGITLITMMIGNVSSAITQGAKATGVTAILDADKINTYAQATQAGDVVGSGVVGKALAFFKPEVISALIGAVFGFGLLYLFGEVFWKVFAVFWQAATKAATAAFAGARAVTAVAKTGVGLGAKAAGGSLSLLSRGLDAGVGKMTGKSIGQRLQEATAGLDGKTDRASNLKRFGLGTLSNLGYASNNAGKILNGVTDAGFDALRFAVDTPGGLINTGKSIWKGVQKQSDYQTQENQQIWKNSAEKTMRRWGMADIADKMENPTYKNMGKDDFADDPFMSFGDPKQIASTLQRYGLSKDMADSVGKAIGRETESTRLEQRSSRLRAADYTRKFDQLQVDEGEELAENKAQKLGLDRNASVETNLSKLQSMSPEEYAYTKALMEEMVNRPEELAKMASEKHFKAMMQHVYKDMSDDARKKLHLSGLHMLADNDIASVVSSLTPNQLRNMEEDVLKDPNVKRIWEGLRDDYSSVLESRGNKKDLFDGSTTVSSKKLSSSAKRATKKYGSGSAKADVEKAMGALQRNASSVSGIDANTFDGLIANALEFTEYDPVTGKHVIADNHKDEIKKRYGKMIESSFGVSSVEQLDKMDSKQLQTIVASTETGQDLGHLFKDTFNADFDANNSSHVASMKALYAASLDAAITDTDQIINKAEMTATTHFDLGRSVGAENDSREQAKVALGKAYDEIERSGKNSTDYHKDVVAQLNTDTGRLDAVKKAAVANTQIAEALAKKIVKGEVGGGPVSSSFEGVIQRTVHKIQSGSMTEATAAITEVQAEVTKLDAVIADKNAPLKKQKEAKAMRAQLSQIKDTLEQVKDVYHNNTAGIATNKAHQDIIKVVAAESEKVYKKIDKRTEAGDIDKGAVKEAIGSLIETQATKQSANRDKFTQAIPVEATRRSLNAVLRNAGSVSATQLGVDATAAAANAAAIQSKAGSILGKDLVAKL